MARTKFSLRKVKGGPKLIPASRMKKYRKMQGMLMLHSRIEQCCDIILKARTDYKRVYGKEEFTQRHRTLTAAYIRYQRAPSTQLGQSINETAAHLLHGLELEEVDRLRDRCLNMREEFIPSDIHQPAAELSTPEASADKNPESSDESQSSNEIDSNASNELFERQESGPDCEGDESDQDSDILVLSKNKKSFVQRELDLPFEDVELGKAVKICLPRLARDKSWTKRRMLLIEYWSMVDQSHGLVLQSEEAMQEINKGVSGFENGLKKLTDAKNARVMRLSQKRTLQAEGQGYDPSYRNAVEEILRPHLQLTYKRFVSPIHSRKVGDLEMIWKSAETFGQGLTQAIVYYRNEVVKKRSPLYAGTVWTESSQPALAVKATAK